MRGGGGAGENAASMERAIDVARAFGWQRDYALANGAPITARVVHAAGRLAEHDLRVGAALRDWPGHLLEDGAPLRLAGGLHNLHLTGDDARLAPVYTGALAEEREVDAAVLAVARDHDARLTGWLGGPPQTNEAARSAAFVAGLLWLARRLGPRFELNEIGASAGINTMIDRYRYELGGVEVGPAGSPMRIAPEWRGAPPPAGDIAVTAIRGCDRTPIDLADPATALRLKSYIWPDMPERMARIDAAIRLARERPPRLERADAGDWAPARLAEPQAAGVTRVLYHSIVWQYLPPETRARIAGAVEAAGAAADRARPLAWLQLETNRETLCHELRVRWWPGGGEAWTTLGETHAHGAWVRWDGGD